MNLIKYNCVWIQPRSCIVEKIEYVWQHYKATNWRNTFSPIQKLTLLDPNTSIIAERNNIIRPSVFHTFYMCVYDSQKMSFSSLIYKSIIGKCKCLIYILCSIMCNHIWFPSGNWIRLALKFHSSKNTLIIKKYV